jgi:hypothetical protein
LLDQGNIGHVHGALLRVFLLNQGALGPPELSPAARQIS